VRFEVIMAVTVKRGPNIFSNVKDFLAACIMLGSGLAYSSTLKMEAICSYETVAYFTGLHGVTSQTIEAFRIKFALYQC
jgi:hypothetical protein